MTSNAVRWPDARDFYARRITDLGITTSIFGRRMYPGTNGSSRASYWLYGYGKLPESMYGQVAEELKCHLGEIYSLYEGQPTQVVKKPKPAKPHTSIVKRVLALPDEPTPIPPREAAPQPVLSVVMLNNGRIRIKLDADLPGKQGIALAQHLYSIQALMGEPAKGE